MTLEEITERVRAAVGSDSGLGKAIKFRITDLGVLHVDKSAVSNEDRPASCTITCNSRDFIAMGTGEADGMMMAIEGQIKVEGDQSVAMRLTPLMSRAFGQA